MLIRLCLLRLPARCVRGYALFVVCIFAVWILENGAGSAGGHMGTPLLGASLIERVEWMLFLMGLPVVLLMVGYFQQGRGAVKGERRTLCGEGVRICVGAVVGLVGRGVAVRRRVSTRITLRGWFLTNVAETRGFYGAEVLSGSGSSAEPVVFSRATHNGVNLGERRVGVKGILFSRRFIDAGELQAGRSV